MHKGVKRLKALRQCQGFLMWFGVKFGGSNKKQRTLGVLLGQQVGINFRKTFLRLSRLRNSWALLIGSGGLEYSPLILKKRSMQNQVEWPESHKR